jgi:hypothetical protein
VQRILSSGNCGFSGIQVQLAVFENEAATAAVESLVRNIAQHAKCFDNNKEVDVHSEDKHHSEAFTVDEQHNEAFGDNIQYYVISGLPISINPSIFENRVPLHRRRWACQAYSSPLSRQTPISQSI